MFFYQGIDLVDIRRVERIYQKFGKQFLSKVLTQNEIKNLFLKNNEKKLVKKIANGFAAKEAVSKALGTGFSDGITMKNIELLNDNSGKPFINLIGKARTRTDFLKKTKQNEILSISISNERNYSIASVNLIFY